MSLKAKIEAVIYASEEPVTLAQLTGLLSHEAQAELDRIESAQQHLALHPEDAPAEAPQPEPDSDDIDAGDVLEMAEDSDDTPSPPELVSEQPLAELAAEAAVSQPPAEQAAEPAASPEKDEKQLAREEKDRARRLREYFRSILDELIADYSSSERGLEIREVASGFRLATKPEYHDAVRGFVKSLKPPLKLSLQALETLAVVAYKQPITAPEISEIRGVDSGGVLGSLMTRKLITTAGRKQVIGRPILYKTTRDFLLRFGLKDVSELPSIEEFEKMAGELAETEVQEEIPMSTPQTEHHAPESPADLEAERGVHAPQADGDPTPLSTAADMEPTPDGTPVPPASERLTGTPPASVVPGADDDPTEAPELAHQIERDQAEREFPDQGSRPSLQPK
ncbi:SMC-Scp complex subunit ScpB [Granulicella sibirica]|uniref:Segregation and condensation protein B n=1 Tax=Granulicella sibirica TaxID=2479048 RepID=A0A4Q0T4X7_9BACT|nr:SMC-Scp complex subunit ScpB [Granulicella sibirica]RXH58795.1 Segregation and condensation protein B [Granulicella sibirica]